MNSTLETVWIIDDDEIYKYGFRKFVSMKKLCGNVIDFSNGKEAIEFLANPLNIEHLPDVIFLDIDMPQMDGWDFIEAFKCIKIHLSRKISIFMVTSSISYKDIVRAKNQTDITEYIVKPVNSQQFSFIFTDVLNRQIDAFKHTIQN